MRPGPSISLLLVCALAGCPSTPPPVSEDAGATTPTITATIPTEGAAAVGLASTLQVDFSVPMDVTSVTVVANPDVDLGDPTWSNAGTRVVFTPPAGLAQEVAYRVTVSGSDPVGTALSGTTTFGFTTMGEPPKVLGSSPTNGATGVPPSTYVSISFSKPMNKASVQGAFVSTPSLGCAWAWNAEGTLATCAPSALLQASTHIKGQLFTSATDLAGRPIEAAYELSFDTAAGPDVTSPTVLSYFPAQDQTGVLENNIKIAFSEPMDRASTEAAFSITIPTKYSYTWNALGTEMTAAVKFPNFPYDTKITWWLKSTAKDLAGNALPAYVTHSYTTIRHKSLNLNPVVTNLGWSWKDDTVASTVGIVGEKVIAGAGVYLSVPYKSYLTFDLSPLAADAPIKIRWGTLRIRQTDVVDAPYQSCGPLLMRHAYWAGSFITVPVTFPGCGTGCSDTATLSTGTAPEINQLVPATWLEEAYGKRTQRGHRFQLLIRFEKDGDNDFGTDNSETAKLQLSAATLTVDYFY